MKPREIGLEYEERDGIRYPKLKSPRGKDTSSIKAQRAKEMLNELNYHALDVVNISGLSDRIWEEIADRVNEKEQELRETLRRDLPKEWNVRVQKEMEIAAEVQRQGDELMYQLVQLLSKAAMTLPHLSDVRAWQLP